MCAIIEDLMAVDQQNNYNHDAAVTLHTPTKISALAGCHLLPVCVCSPCVVARLLLLGPQECEKYCVDAGGFAYFGLQYGQE